MSGVQLFGRLAHVTVGTLLLEGTDGTGLDVSFKVKRNLKPLPNTCDLKIWGLSKSSRQALAGSTVPAPTMAGKQKIVPCRIEAGYKGATYQIFLGELRAAQTTRQGQDVITELSTGDGDQAIKTGRINVTLGPGTTTATAMKQLLGALGIGQGNLAKAVTLLGQAGLVQMYAKGASLKGSAADHLTDLCRSAGLEWSIQDGQLQVTTLGQPLDGQAISLTPSTGLVGSPSVDTKGIVSAKCLMIPGLKPGVKVAIQSESVTGGFRVISTEHTGDTFGSDWYVDIEAQRY